MASNGTSNGVSNGTPKSAPNETSLSVDNPSEDLLYHVKCEIIDYLNDKSGATRTNNIYGTYTSLPAAKAAARTCLQTAGYLPSDFTTYAEKAATGTTTNTSTWPYGDDDILIYALAPAGQEFRVRLDVTPNTAHPQLSANPATQEVEGHLHYVLQTNIDYSKDASGGSQSTAVQGVYLGLKEANHAAYNVLFGDAGADADGLTRKSFVEFERVDEHRGDWPYGEHVLVHAVAENGENFRVEVRMRARVHHKRECTHRYEAGAWK